MSSLPSENGVNGHSGLEANQKLSLKTEKLVEEWQRLDKNTKTCSEILSLAREGNEDELQERLGLRMTFGTAGLRALMGAGYSRMNDLTIIQTTQGLASYILEKFGESECQSRGVVVGYDARHNSFRFGQLAASIFLNKNFKVYLFSTYTPTPFTPYAIKKYQCLAGIQVTASHNPKEYNGYKVYWDNGAQIIPPHDAGISTHINRQLTPWTTSWDTSIVSTSKNIVDPFSEVEEGYFNDIQKYCYRRSENSKLGIKFTFSPMHGVGGEPVKKAFKAFSLPSLVPVAEQMEPDPEFPTVKFPNPEEGKSALNLAMKTAEEAGSNIILATDPDADRLALAERNVTTGKWKIFSGNELGTLLSWWAFRNFKEKNPNFDGSKVYMLASTVSSKFIKSLAKIEGFQFEETLTGFKWMGNRSHDHLEEGCEVLFAYEEAIGFMFGTTVLDKDGISAAAVLAEYGGWLYSQGKTFGDQLELLYQRYGRFMSEVSYFLCYDRETIKEVFQRLRHNREYPTTCGCSAKVLSVVDLTVGYDSRRPPDFKPVLPVDPNCQLITFTLDNQCVFTLRTSGTEPKIKYYIEVTTEPGTNVTEQDMKVTLDQAVKCVKEEYLLPEQYGLIPRPT